MKTTITVIGYFGDKEMTKEQFVNEWKQHGQQLYSISQGNTEEVYNMVRRIEQIAAERFDFILQEQAK